MTAIHDHWNNSIRHAGRAVCILAFDLQVFDQAQRSIKEYVKKLLHLWACQQLAVIKALGVRLGSNAPVKHSRHG